MIASNEEVVTCSEGTFSSNEIYCSILSKCPKETSYRIQRFHLPDK